MERYYTLALQVPVERATVARELGPSAGEAPPPSGARGLEPTGPTGGVDGAGAAGAAAGAPAGQPRPPLQQQLQEQQIAPLGLQSSPFREPRQQGKGWHGSADEETKGRVHGGRNAPCRATAATPLLPRRSRHQRTSRSPHHALTVAPGRPRRPRLRGLPPPQRRPLPCVPRRPRRGTRHPHPPTACGAQPSGAPPHAHSHGRHRPVHTAQVGWRVSGVQRWLEPGAGQLPDRLRVTYCWFKGNPLILRYGSPRNTIASNADLSNWSLKQQYRTYTECTPVPASLRRRSGSSAGSGHYVPLRTAGSSGRIVLSATGGGADAAKAGAAAGGAGPFAVGPLQGRPDLVVPEGGSDESSGISSGDEGRGSGGVSSTSTSTSSGGGGGGGGEKEDRCTASSPRHEPSSSGSSSSDTVVGPPTHAHTGTSHPEAAAEVGAEMGAGAGAGTDSEDEGHELDREQQARVRQGHSRSLHMSLLRSWAGGAPPSAVGLSPTASSAAAAAASAGPSAPENVVLDDGNFSDSPHLSDIQPYGTSSEEGSGRGAAGAGGRGGGGSALESRRLSGFSDAEVHGRVGGRSDPGRWGGVGVGGLAGVMAAAAAVFGSGKGGREEQGAEQGQGRRGARGNGRRASAVEVARGEGSGGAGAVQGRSHRHGKHRPHLHRSSSSGVERAARAGAGAEEEGSIGASGDAGAGSGRRRGRGWLSWLRGKGQEQGQGSGNGASAAAASGAPAGGSSAGGESVGQRQGHPEGGAAAAAAPAAPAAGAAELPRAVDMGAAGGSEPPLGAGSSERGRRPHHRHHHHTHRHYQDDQGPALRRAESDTEVQTAGHTADYEGIGGSVEVRAAGAAAAAAPAGALTARPPAAGSSLRGRPSFSAADLRHVAELETSGSPRRHSHRHHRHRHHHARGYSEAGAESSEQQAEEDEGDEGPVAVRVSKRARLAGWAAATMGPQLTARVAGALGPRLLAAVVDRAMGAGVTAQVGGGCTGRQELVPVGRQPRSYIRRMFFLIDPGCIGVCTGTRCATCHMVARGCSGAGGTCTCGMAWQAAAAVGNDPTLCHVCAYLRCDRPVTVTPWSPPQALQVGCIP